MTGHSHNAIVDDLRLGQLLRAARIRRGWRQQDVAERAGVSRTAVSDLERGRISQVRVGVLRAVAEALEVQLTNGARFRGGEGERLISARHAALAEFFTRYVQPFDWAVRPEVSFSIYGERGIVDLLCWHEQRRALAVIELKTEIVDVGELLGTFDRKRRLAIRIARDLGLLPETVGAWVIVAESRTNRRLLARHVSLIRAALPADGRSLRAWLCDPAVPVAGLAFLPISVPGGVRRGGSGLKRVRRARATPRRAGSSTA